MSMEEYGGGRMDFKVLKESLMGNKQEDRERFHLYHELYYIAEGRCSVFIGQRTYHLRAGDFAVIPAGTLHKTDFLSQGQNTKYVVSFSRETARQVERFLQTDVTQKGLRPGTVAAPVQRQQTIELLLSRMLYEYENNPPQGEAFCMALLAQLLISLFRYRAGEMEEEKTADPRLGRMQAVAAYICQHSREPLTLAELAAHFALSPSHLSRTFRQATGFGVWEYLTHYRIQKACELLRDSQFTVTEIADRCGFNDSNYFGDAFRKAVGVSPREYRKLSG